MNKRRLVLIFVVILLFFGAGYFSFKYLSPQTDSARTAPGGVKAPIEPAYNEPIGAQYTDIALFLSPIRQTRIAPATGTVSGLIVSHHLLAKDLTANAFAYAALGQYQKIVLLSPDHFQAGQAEVSVTERNFSTVFGEVKTDAVISKKLKELPFVSEGDFFYREHGLQAELPFIKYYFPAAEVIALTFKPTVSQAELDQVVAILAKELPGDSLIIQSTDFSHYLTPAQALERDAETINTLKQNDPGEILSLKQPENIDSLAAQYIQARLQKDFFGARFNILDHKNSQDYTAGVVTSSTSYITAAYIKPNEGGEVNGRKVMGSAEFIFVGDVMLSRYIGEMMAKQQDYNFPFAAIKPFLAAADLIFGNLESPISDAGESTGRLYPLRADPQVARGLKDAGFTVLSVANNHAFDYGRVAFLDTLNNLKKAGLAYTGGGYDFPEAHQGAYQEINGVKITFLAYTDLLPKSEAADINQAGFTYLDLKQMAKDIKFAKEKSDLVIVSFHWGREYETKHNIGQEKIAEAAIVAGASLIIGHHPHVFQEVTTVKGVTVAYSLGNFIFDQNFSPETKMGLTLKVLIKDKKIANIETQTVYFNHYYQPYIAD